MRNSLSQILHANFSGHDTFLGDKSAVCDRPYPWRPRAGREDFCHMSLSRNMEEKYDCWTLHRNKGDQRGQGWLCVECQPGEGTCSPRWPSTVVCFCFTLTIHASRSGKRGWGEPPCPLPPPSKASSASHMHISLSMPPPPMRITITNEMRRRVHIALRDPIGAAHDDRVSSISYRGVEKEERKNDELRQDGI